MIEEDDHSLFVLEDERIDDFHVALLDAELDKVGEVLKALGHHDEGAIGGGRGRLRDEVELARVEDGGTQEAEEDEAGDGASLDEPLVRPLDGHVALETVADVPAGVGKFKSDTLDALIKDKDNRETDNISSHLLESSFENHT